MQEDLDRVLELVRRTEAAVKQHHLSHEKATKALPPQSEYWVEVEAATEEVRHVLADVVSLYESYEPQGVQPFEGCDRYQVARLLPILNMCLKGHEVIFYVGGLTVLEWELEELKESGK